VTWNRIDLCGVALSTSLILAAAATVTSAQQPADSSATRPGRKPKKVWANDDLAPGSPALAPIANTATAKAETVPTPPAKNATPQPANQLRPRLERLQAQWKDANTQLEKLKQFQSGEARRQLHQGYNMEPIPDQIAKLEEKMRRLQLQIDAIYDQARKKETLPGQLR
jgi:hypothetical protein